MARLTGKCAVVTGAASGIGHAIVELFTEEGARVVAVDRPGSSILSIFKANAAVKPMEQDITEANAADRVTQAVTNEFGTLDILVNNAGVIVSKPIQDHDMETWRRVMSVNLDAAMALTARTASMLTKSKAGRVISIGSGSSLQAIPGGAAYITSKHAIVGLAKCVAADLAPFGVTSNVILPGSTETGMTDEIVKRRPDYRSQLANKVPLKRMARPIDIAYAALFLASDEAAYITAQEIVVDGGLSAIMS